MTQTQFLKQLKSISNSYKWEVVGNSIFGVAKYGKDRGSVFNPVTAVARSSERLGSYSLKETVKAARLMGLSEDVAREIVSSSNRGFAQIIRGRMKNQLGV